ncbi:MAG: AGE family epimerase/isomerase [Opitutaceae bacterium]|nr:AGE family epimerase/isomerase [Opitutaceae bacterium]
MHCLPRLLPLLATVLALHAAAPASAVPEAADLAILDRLAASATAELNGNILPFWMSRTCDTEHGGFFAELRADGTPNLKAPRGALMTCRILWTYSAAMLRDRRQDYRDMARRAFQDLDRSYWDVRHGGVFWTVDVNGAPVDSHKQTYLQAFAIFGLSEYHRATDDATAFIQARKIFWLLEKHARDREHGGYLEAFNREWTEELPKMRRLIGGNAPKSQNTHLHLMEAYTNLLRVWPDEQLREALHSLVVLMLDRILDPETHHLRLYFESDWTPASRAISYGHDIEAAWLLCDAADALGDADLQQRTRRVAVDIARTTLAEGVSPLGGIYNAGGPKGVTDRDHEWWSQAEAVVGFLHVYKLSGDAQYLRAAERTWDFIDRHVIDRAGGEWFLMVDPEGRPRPNRVKAGMWKCPYHNGRACMEIADRVAAIKTQ